MDEDASGLRTFKINFLGCGTAGWTIFKTGGLDLTIGIAFSIEIPV